MKEPEALKKYIQTGDIRVHRPPENVKPAEDFERIFCAYKSWCAENPDRGYTAFLAARQGLDRSEDTSWGIRGSLRRMGAPEGPPENALILKWYLILHMAREIEMRHLEADLLLGDLRKTPPLRGLLDPEGEEGAGVLDDLPGFRAEPFVHESQWGQVVESWLGLFEGSIGETGTLVTFDRRVLDFLWALRDQPSLAEVPKDDTPVRFRIPFRFIGLREGDRATGREDSDPGSLRALLSLLADTKLSSDARMKGLRRLAEDIETSLPGDPGEETVEIGITTLALPPARSLSRDLKSLVPLAGRTVVFVGDR